MAIFHFFIILLDAFTLSLCGTICWSIHTYISKNLEIKRNFNIKKFEVKFLKRQKKCNWKENIKKATHLFRIIIGCKNFFLRVTCSKKMYLYVSFVVLLTLENVIFPFMYNWEKKKTKKTKKLKEMRVLSLFSHEFTFHNHNTKRIIEKCNQKREGEAKLVFWIICYFGVFTCSSLSMYLLSDKCVLSFNSLANIIFTPSYEF